MWIQELFIDEFDGTDDLTLQRLSNTLNVIRVPSDAEAKQLCRFVPCLLFGKVVGNGRPRGGTLVVQHRLLDDSFAQFDLSRFGDGTLGLDGRFDLGQLQIGAEDPIEDELTLLRDGLKLIDSDFYLATFTDVMPPAQRIATWKESKWIESWLQPSVQEVVEETTVEETDEVSGAPDTNALATTPQNGAVEVARLSLHTNRYAEWYEACSLRRKQLAASETNASKNSPVAQQAPAEEAKHRQRKDYFDAKQSVCDLREQIQKLRRELAEFDGKNETVRRAVALVDKQKRLQKKRRSKTNSTAADLKAAKRLEKELAELREQLQAQRQTDERILQQDREADAANIDVEIAKFERALENWDECLKHQAKISDLRRQMSQDSLADGVARSSDSVADSTWLADDETNPNTGSMSQQEATHAIKQLQEAARRRTIRRKVKTSSEPQRSISDVKADADRTDDQMVSLQRQIRQLRDECRMLLSRQLLSRQTLAGVGMLFSAGAAILLSAVFLDLDGAEVPTGSIGLICVMAALLLKTSFERAPSRRLRQQRLRVAGLLRELESLKDRKKLFNAKLADGLSSTQTSDSASKMQEVVEYEPIETRDQRYHETLARFDLPSHLKPQEAITRIRKRIGGQPRQPFKKRSAIAPPTQDLTQQMRHHQDQVTRWCNRAIELLPEHNDTAESSAEPNELYAALRIARQELMNDRKDKTLKGNTPNASVTEAAADLQAQIKELKLQRSKLFDRTGVKSIAALERKLQQEKARPEKQRRTLSPEIEGELKQDAEGELIRGWLMEHADLDSIRREYAERANELKQQLSEKQTKLQQHESEIERFARQRPSFADHSQSVDDEVELSIETLDLTQAVLRSLESILEQPKPEPVEAAPAPTVKLRKVVPSVRTVTGPAEMLKLASDYLASMSEELDRIVWESPGSTVAVVDQYNDEISFADLSSNDQHLVAFALQLAMIRELSETVELPMILRDASLRHRQETCDRIAELLAEFSEDGQQVLLITVQPSITELFHQLGIPSLVVSRQTTVGPAAAKEHEAPSDPLQPTPIDVAVPTSLPLVARTTPVEYQEVHNSWPQAPHHQARTAVDAIDAALADGGD